jgi:multidrug resistance efflux pump
MGQLEKLQTAREQIKSMQLRQDNTVEQLLLEMQRRQWLSERGMLEKREIMVALTEVQRAKARGLDDRKREELVSLE